MDYTKKDIYNGIEEDEVTKGISSVPFIWTYFGKKIDMNFYGGFFATKCNLEENSVEPELCWVIERKNK